MLLNNQNIRLSIPLLLFLFTFTSLSAQKVSIDRFALVNRHNITLTKADTMNALSVGNGEFAFTVDASGLQTFPAAYENGISLGTQSQWGWHSFPNSDNYTLQDVLKEYPSCNDKIVPYPIQHSEGRAGEATRWLRSNPHRLHLGLVGLSLLKKDGSEARLEDLQQMEQKLDLWTGKIESNYKIEGTPVRVELYCHQNQDLISFRITSPLVAAERLKVQFRFPYGNECHVCPGYDWESTEKHETNVISPQKKEVLLQRKLDKTTYQVQIGWQQKGTFARQKPHYFELSPAKAQTTFECSILFSQHSIKNKLPDFKATQQNSTAQWKRFWTEGGAIDFSECTDPRAKELERRVVLSQYLTKIQCAGSRPPQETGLTFNSWYGKFHLEMHWWHGVHFALWNRMELLEKSLDWYQSVLGKAKATAKLQGYAGARWQKMTSPDGDESPSSVGAFLVWQQPHPIYYAELVYRQKPGKETLERFQSIVFETADFMASFAQWDEKDKKYHLCAPLIPAQELFKAQTTSDPPFELTYWHWGLSVAQAWRKRLGLPPDEKWQHVIDNLASLPIKDNFYLPDANSPTAYLDDNYRRDHPVVVGAYGMLPLSARIDTVIMANTFQEIMRKWDWQSTWGWDYPMLAMSAARLGMPDKAVDALLMDVQKNTYLKNGHNYQDARLRIYLPGNGGLLTAVAMMAAGWDNAPNQKNPGFPNNGKWKIKWENLSRMP